MERAQLSLVFISDDLYYVLLRTFKSGVLYMTCKDFIVPYQLSQKACYLPLVYTLATINKRIFVVELK